MLQEKCGHIIAIIYENRDNGYVVAQLQTEDEEITITGNIHTPKIGYKYILRGEDTNHSKYGRQFKFREYEEAIPSDEESIRSLLASGGISGIGPKNAELIVNKFGDRTLDIIKNDISQLLSLPGIGKKTVEKIKVSFEKNMEFTDIAIKLQKYGVTSNYAMKLYKRYGEATIDEIEKNPYNMIDDVFGIGFKKADLIAIKMGHEHGSELRIKSGIEYVLKFFLNEGNTFLPYKFLSEKVGELLDVNTETINEAVFEMAFEGIVQVEDVEGRNVVYLMPYYLAEKNICKNIYAINSAQLTAISTDIESLIDRTERISKIILSENQKNAIKNSLENGITIITGGPGTGKTTIINSILNILEDGGLKVAIAAPTGRAAKRITETTEHEASTIHRLLEYFYTEDENRMEFGKNSEDRLEYDAVIIDEASMIDLMLMEALVSAIKPGTRLIIVGDADQLPSVGAGNVLHDLIESEYLYCNKLTEIFRQAKESMIVVNAHKINQGDYPECNENDKDFFLLDRKTEEDMVMTIKDLVSHRLPEYYQGLSPLRDIQVLTPIRKRTVGTKNLNIVLQDVLNPKNENLIERKFGDRLFREGDKVMQIKNNYSLSWKNIRDFTDGQGIFNGEIGFIDNIDNEYNKMSVIFDEAKYVTYDFAKIDELELAYAMTVHKSQGSEFPIIVMPISWFPEMLANRNLLYTAITRGKTAVVLVGSEDKLHGMVDNNSIKERYSGLLDRLKKLMNYELLGN